MTALNVVRFEIKPGMEETFLEAHRNAAEGWLGLRHANIIHAGEGRYCIIAEWESKEALAAARPQMIATLDSFRQIRQTLMDLGDGLGGDRPYLGICCPLDEVDWQVGSRSGPKPDVGLPCLPRSRPLIVDIACR
jgi:Antibiotic biosynthesis monooxygenase